MQIQSNTGHNIKVSLGRYDTENISLKTLMKVFVDDIDVEWSGFYPLNPNEMHVFRQSRYTLLDQIPVGVEDSFLVAQALLAHIDRIFTMRIKNPALQANLPKWYFMSVLDAHQKATIAAIIYRMKLYGGFSAAIGTKEFLSIEELIFLEDCLRVSPYLKTLAQEITLDEFMGSFKMIYHEILKKRMKFESLMDLHPQVLAYVYQDMPEASSIKH